MQLGTKVKIFKEYVLFLLSEILNVYFLPHHFYKLILLKVVNSQDDTKTIRHLINNTLITYVCL